MPVSRLRRAESEGWSPFRRRSLTCTAPPRPPLLRGCLPPPPAPGPARQAPPGVPPGLPRPRPLLSGARTASRPAARAPLPAQLTHTHPRDRFCADPATGRPSHARLHCIPQTLAGPPPPPSPAPPPPLLSPVHTLTLPGQRRRTSLPKSPFAAAPPPPPRSARRRAVA